MASEDLVLDGQCIGRRGLYGDWKDDRVVRNPDQLCAQPESAGRPEHRSSEHEVGADAAAEPLWVVVRIRFCRRRCRADVQPVELRQAADDLVAQSFDRRSSSALPVMFRSGATARTGRWPSGSTLGAEKPSAATDDAIGPGRRSAASHPADQAPHAPATTTAAAAVPRRSHRFRTVARIIRSRSAEISFADR